MRTLRFWAMKCQKTRVPCPLRGRGPVRQKWKAMEKLTWNHWRGAMVLRGIQPFAYIDWQLQHEADLENFQGEGVRPNFFFLHTPIPLANQGKGEDMACHISIYSSLKIVCMIYEISSTFCKISKFYKISYKSLYNLYKRVQFIRYLMKYVRYQS